MGSKEELRPVFTARAAIFLPKDSKVSLRFSR